MTDPRIIARCALMLAATAASTMTPAQVIAPSAAASAAAEKAQKETDRTKYWIRVLATTPSAKSAAKPAAAAPVAAPAQQAKAAPAPERAKTVAAAPAPSQTSAGIANVNAAPPAAAAAPSLTAATGTAQGGAGGGKNSATTSGGLDAGVSSADLGGGLAAPTVAPPPIDAPVAEEELDPGLIMIKSVDPEFPISAMSRQRKGAVEVKFEVGADGIVGVVTVMKTTSTSLNAAAADAVRQWRFKPTPKGHIAMVRLVFNLDS